MKIAFFGLGVMGLPMARNLLGAGHTVVATRRGSRNEAAFQSAGGALTETVADALSGAEAAITMLPDSPNVESVALGPGGIIESGAAGLLYADMSTVTPGTSREVAARSAERGIRCVDAPVSGSLSIMVGGAAADVEAFRPIFESLGSTISHVGPSGSGQTVKAANQLLVAGHLQLLAEAIVFLEATEVDVSEALHVIGAGLAGSAVLERRGASMLSRSFAPGFRIDLHHKDLGILDAAAREAGVVLPLGTQVRQLMAAARATGAGGLDHTALIGLTKALCSAHPELYAQPRRD